MGIIFAPILIPLATFVAPLYYMFNGDFEGAFTIIDTMYTEFFPMAFAALFGI